jgi:osmotically-inducible protein OsmY
MTDRYVRDSISRLLSSLKPDGVRVEVEAGIVYLEGVAESAAHKQLLETLVRRVQGVRAVINCLALEHIAPQPSF